MTSLQLENGQVLMANKFGAQSEEKVDLELSPEEKNMEETVKVPKLFFNRAFWCLSGL